MIRLVDADAANLVRTSEDQNLFFVKNYVIRKFVIALKKLVIANEMVYL